ncbi:hypothetical protein [Actibacterium sp. 188UL27-1]|uniref:hypothetical protein n=1 Tax=Actibacterium sp. 188UL27-1 TaxID=2786961 RepID=UPI00195ED280|nr:hypothetical protein [Actibacterium sp. 188UL27-1]MBM7068636.1 hypothetical protein [Actibacterium sp. 188UL27-1]
MTRSFLAIIVALSVTACAPAEIKTPPVTVTPNVPSKASGIDVYARDRARGNPVPRFRGQNIVQVRTRGKGSDNKTSELSGVPCNMDSGVYKAKFRSPANVIVPDYGPNSPAIFVRCVLDKASGSATVSAYNLTNQQRVNAGAGAGLLGVLVAGAVAAAKRDDTKDDFAYPPITITVK